MRGARYGLVELAPSNSVHVSESSDEGQDGMGWAG